jgi:hypothetical protein
MKNVLASGGWLMGRMTRGEAHPDGQKTKMKKRAVAVKRK